MASPSPWQQVGPRKTMAARSNVGHMQRSSLNGVERSAAEIEQEMEQQMEPDLRDTSHMTFVDGRCSCCPYGYHIDLDFLRYLEALNDGSYLTNLKKIHRNKKKLRKSLEVLVHQRESTGALVLPPDVVHSTDHSFSSKDGAAAILDEIDFSVDSIDLLMRNGGEERGSELCRSEAEIRLEGAQPIHRSSSISSMSSSYSEVTPVDAVSPSREIQVYVTSTQLADNMATLLSSEGDVHGSDGLDTALGQTSLQAIREQMALSLQRMRELEEQVKAIPVLQVRISVLKEEKRLLMLQLRAKKNKLNMRSIGVGDAGINDADQSVRYQTSMMLAGQQRGAPATRTIGVGDATTDGGDMAVALNGDFVATRVHQRELHSEHKTNEYEKEVRTMFLGQAQTAEDSVTGRRVSGRPPRPLPPTRSIGVGSDTVLDTNSSSSSDMHVHEKELRTLIIGGAAGAPPKSTRNVGIVCKAPTRDIGVMYMYEDAKPDTRNVAVGVGEMGVSDEGWELGEGGGVGGSSTHTTLTSIQQMNLAAFHSRHVHIKGAELRMMLDEVLHKDLHSVGLQTEPLSSCDKAVGHHGYNMVDVGSSSDTLDVDIRPVVLTRSVGVESRPQMQNRSVTTVRVLGNDAGSNTPPAALLVHRSTLTNPVKSYPASTNTDACQLHTAQTNTDVKMFQALGQVTSTATNTTRVRSADLGVNTDVEVKVVEPKVATCDRSNNTPVAKLYNQSVNTTKTLCIERGSNTEKTRLRHSSSNTHAPTTYSLGINVNTLTDASVKETMTRKTSEDSLVDRGSVADEYDLSSAIGVRVQRSPGSSTHSINESYHQSEPSDERQSTRTTSRRTVTTYGSSSSPVVSRKVVTSGDTPRVTSSVRSITSRHNSDTSGDSRYSDAKDSDFDVDTERSSSGRVTRTYTTERSGDTPEWTDEVGDWGDRDRLGSHRVVSERSSPRGSTVTTKTTKRVTTSSLSSSPRSSTVTTETVTSPTGVEFQQNDNGTTQMRVVRHTETAYVGGNAVNQSSNVTIHSEDDATSPGVPDLLRGGATDDDNSGGLLRTTNGNHNLDAQGNVTATTPQKRIIAVRPKSIMKQTIQTTTETVMDTGGLKKEISFSEDVHGGDASSSSGEELEEDELEEDESQSGGSQSSVSYDEASYDGRAGKIEYSCQDDEVIAAGVPGATMYDQDIRETFELEPALSAACKVYAQWLQDSTLITTKELNSAISVIQEEWFKISSHKLSQCDQVVDYLTVYSDFSKELLQHIINMSDANGNTALHYAVSHGNMDIVGLLLDSKHCDINKENKAGYTAIMLASLAHIQNEPQRAIVKRLFEIGDINARALQAGQTALMLAVSHGRLDMVRMLMEAGADVNMSDEDGSTALMCASEHGHAEIVKLLLAHPDVDPTLTDNDGSTALSIAMEAGHRDIGVLLYAHVNFKAGSPVLARTKLKRKSSSNSPNSPRPSRK